MSDRSGLADFFDNTGANIYSDGSDDNERYLTTHSLVASLGNYNENGINSMLRDASFLLPDQKTMNLIDRMIVNRIHPANSREDAGYYYQSENGGTNFLYAGQSITRNGREDVGPALVAKLPELLKRPDHGFGARVLDIHSHPHPRNNSIQEPTFPHDYDGVNKLGQMGPNMNGGIMTTRKSMFFYKGLNHAGSANHIEIKNKIMRKIIK